MANYAFPNIQFTTSVVGPTPVTRQWRDAIGVVGEFTRGPSRPIVITNRSDFQAIFGEDGSSGSLAVQQAMQVGASNFVIARAVPVSSASTVGFNIASPSPYALDPIVGYTIVSGNPVPNYANRTVGLNLSLNYVGNPITKRVLYGPVSTQSTTITHPTFKGRANLNCIVTGYVDGAAASTSVYPAGISHVVIEVTANLLSGSTVGEFRMLRISPAAANNVAAFASGNPITLSYIKGGYVLAANTLADGSGTACSFQVLSPVQYNYFANGDHAVLVKVLTATGAATPTPFITAINFPTSGVYVMGYTLSLLDQTTLAPITASSEYLSLADTYDDGYNLYPIDGYFLVPYSFSFPYAGTDFQYFTVPTAAISTATLTASVAVTAESLTSTGLPIANQGILINWVPPAIIGTVSYPAFVIGGQFAIPFAKDNVTVGGISASATTAYAMGTPSTRILSDLTAAVYSNASFSSLIADVTTVTQVPPYSFTFNSNLKGIEANRITLTLKSYTQTAAVADDLYFKISSGQVFAAIDPTAAGLSLPLAGGIDGPTTAFIDFYTLNGIPLTRVEFLSPGTIGNSVYVSVTPVQGIGNGAEFVLSMTIQENGKLYSQDLVLNNYDVDPTSGLYKASQNSTIANVFFLPIAEPFANANGVPASTYGALPLRIAPPLGRNNLALNSGVTASASQAGSFITNVFLKGGTDVTPSLSKTQAKILGYSAALKAMEQFSVAYLAVVGLPLNTVYNPVFAILQSQVDKAKPASGLRLGIVEIPAGTTPKGTASVSSQFTNTGNIVAVRGHVTMLGSDGVSKFSGASAVGLYAGFRAVRPPFFSPASVVSNLAFTTILSVDTSSLAEDLDLFTRNHVEVLFYDSALGQVRFLNGLTTSTDILYKRSSVRTIKNEIDSALYNSLQFSRSQPNSSDLQNRVSSSVDALLTQKLNDGYLTRLSATTCGAANNTTRDQLTGNLNITVRYTPSIPADQINVQEILDITDTFSIPTATTTSTGA